MTPQDQTPAEQTKVDQKNCACIKDRYQKKKINKIFVFYPYILTKIIKRIIN